VLTIFPSTQTLRGGGPGSLLSRRYSGKPAGTAASGTKETLQCLHLTFTGVLDGAYAENRVTFRQNVAAILGPIRDWSDALDVDRINVIAPEQSRLETQELSVFSTKDLPSVKLMEKEFPGSTKAAWQIDAKGALIVESNTEQGVINVNAYRGSYDALHEVLSVEGSPQQPAHVRKDASASQPNGIDSDLTKGLFNLKTGDMQINTNNIRGSMPNQLAPNGAGVAPGGRPVVAPPRPANQSAIPSPRDFNVLPSQQNYQQSR
jgi:hypothetical protein